MAEKGKRYGPAKKRKRSSFRMPITQRPLPRIPSEGPSFGSGEPGQTKATEDRLESHGGLSDSLDHLSELQDLLKLIDKDGMLTPYQWVRIGDLFNLLHPAIESMRGFWDRE